MCSMLGTVVVYTYRPKMCSNISVLLCLVLCVSLGHCSLAPFVSKCKWDDSSCIKDSAQKAIPMFAKGIPELNVEPLDPLKFDKIDASSQNLKLILTDSVITGLQECEAKKFSRDIEKSKLYVNLQCNGILNANYEINGKLFVLPIEGTGNLYANLRKVVIDAEVDMGEKTGKDGKKHWAVKGWKHTFELKDKCDVKFDNLFPDNEFLRKTTNDFIAGNGNDIVLEIGPPIMQALVQRVVEHVKKFFGKVPVEDLAIE